MRGEIKSFWTGWVAKKSRARYLLMSSSFLHQQNTNGLNRNLWLHLVNFNLNHPEAKGRSTYYQTAHDRASLLNVINLLKWIITALYVFLQVTWQLTCLYQVYKWLALIFGIPHASKAPNMSFWKWAINQCEQSKKVVTISQSIDFHMGNRWHI